MKKTLSLFLALITVLTYISGCSNQDSKPGTTTDLTTNPVTTPSVSTPEATTEKQPYSPNPSNPYAELFLNPTAEYRWHDMDHYIAEREIAKEGSIDSLLKTMTMYDTGGVVTNVPFYGGYVDKDSYFDALNEVSKKLIDSGFEIWLYDELGYPSGSAGGRVTIDNPEYTAWGLTVISQTGKGKTPVAVNKDPVLLDIYSAYAVDSKGNSHKATVNGDTVTFAGTDGDWTLYVFVKKKFYEGTHAEGNGFGGKEWLTRDYPNLLDKDAVKKFIEVTYKPYVEKYDYFDQVIGVFTDEPSLMERGSNMKYAQRSWVNGFEDSFYEMHGYRIEDKLHYLFTGTSSEARIVRVNYRQTVAQIISESYFKQINDYCVENGSYLSGHLFAEESLSAHVTGYGDNMQCLRQMGIPGVDVLNVGQDKLMSQSSPIYMSAKYASSVATIAGKGRLTMAELCALDIPTSGSYNNEEIKKIWQTVNMLYFGGITHINAYVDIVNTGRRAVKFIDYSARLGYLSRQLTWDGEIGVYYPINTYQSHEGVSGYNDGKTLNTIMLKLHQNQNDFCMVDNQFILEADIKDGRIFNDHVSFSVILMPKVDVVPLDVLKKLLEFEQSGGYVFWVNGTPTLPDNINDIDEFKSLASKLKITNLNSSSDLNKIKMAAKYSEIEFDIEGSSVTLMVGKYKLGDAPAYWLYNDAGKLRSCDISCDGAKGFDVYDPITGEITSIDGSSCTIDLEQYCAKIVIIKK